MEDIDFRNSCQEVYQVLYSLRLKDFIKIPQAVIEYIDSYRNKDYEYIFDTQNQQYSELTASILLAIYYDYIADDKTKKLLEDIVELKQKEISIKENMQEKKEEPVPQEPLQDSSPIKEQVSQPVQENYPVLYKENFFTRIISKIKEFFSIFTKK